MTRQSELQNFRDQNRGYLPASVTSTAAEINILDGVTATYDELNILEGVTATAAELNKLDGASPLSFINTGAARTDKTDDYTAVIGDANTCIDFGTASGKTFTIPANASVAFPVGTVLVVTKSGANALTLAITSDTLVGIGTTLAASGGVALIIKVAAALWVTVSGDLS